MNNRKISSGILFVCLDDSTVLLLKRSDSVKNPRKWGIPGGKQEDKDESTLDTAKRESKEELSSLPRNKKQIGSHIIYRNKNPYEIFIYIISKIEKEKWSPKIKLDDENEKYKWFSVNKLPKNQHFNLNWIKDKVKAMLKK